jgi:hypothetical protein
MVEQRKTHLQERRGGRFFGRRVNCELVPSLPAQVVGLVLDDPRKIPFLLVWKNPRSDTVEDAARISAYSERPSQFLLDWTGWIEIRRPDRTGNFLRTVLRPLPRNRGKARLLVCPHCQNLRRALYGWKPGGEFTSSVYRSNWQCRTCAGLRHASEGGALVHRDRAGIARLFDGPFRSDRPEPWYPYVFTSPGEAAEAGLCNLS